MYDIFCEMTSMKVQPQHALPTVSGGGVGAVGWPGGFGGWWRADTGDDSVLVFLTHNLIERDQFAHGIGFGVYDAITKFQALATPSVSR
jgi:hypothetical protein